MTPRPRKRKNSALPENLYQSKKGQYVSFIYRHPVKKTRHGLGSDKAKAIQAAKQLNSILVPRVDFVSKVLGTETIEQHIEWFKREIIPERDYANKTREMYTTKFGQIKRELGADTPVDTVTVKDIADAMDNLTKRSAQQFRQVAVDLFKTAIGRGLIEANPAEASLKPVAKKKRQRLTREQFDAVYEAAPQWLKNAMDLAIVTLQRREDIVLMQFDRYKREEKALYVIQGKTKKYDTGYLRVTAGQQLNEIITRCRDDIASPFLVHRDPERRIRREDMHWTQIKPDYVSRTFKELTDELEIFSSIPRDIRPTFHEIKALGIKEYKDRKLNPQQLAGHASETMTDNYDSDHEDIRWIEAESL